MLDIYLLKEKIKNPFVVRSSQKSKAWLDHEVPIASIQALSRMSRYGRMRPSPCCVDKRGPGPRLEVPPIIIIIYTIIITS